MMLALFAMGVGVGSLARRAAAARRGERALRADLAALRWPLFAFDLFLASAGRAPARQRRRRWFSARREAGASSSISLALAIAGGVFTVPLYAILQHDSEPAHRARVIAANNIVNSLLR